MTTQRQDLMEESRIRRTAKESRDREISTLAAQGHSSGQIASLVKEKSGTVLAIMKRLGIPAKGRRCS